MKKLQEKKYRKKNLDSVETEDEWGIEKDEWGF